jgi:hypothetical protein
MGTGGAREPVALAAVTALAVALGVTPGAAGAPAGGRTSAKTSQGQAMSLKTSRRGVRFSIGWSAACNDGGDPFVATTSNTKPLKLRRGRFGIAGSFTGKAADGVEVSYTVSLSGRVKGRKGSGSWRIAASGPDTQGGRWSCDTGAVSWTAGGKSKRTGKRAGAAAGGLSLKTSTRQPGRRTPRQPPTPPPAPPPAPPPPPPPPPPPNQPTEVSGQVLYAQRECYAGNAVRELPLANARIELVSGSNVVETTLDDQGRFQNIGVPGDGLIDAFAFTDGPHVSVTPDEDGAAPYLIGLGRVTSSNQVFHIGSVGNAPPQYTEGAANIYGTLEQGARVAVDASPVGIPKITARWRYGLGGNWLGDRAGSAYDSNTKTIFIGGRLFPTDGDISGTPEAVASARDEYEQFPLLHEYGHHVLENVATPPEDAAGNHDFGSIHPDNPGLPWSEGFAHAYAAITTGNPQQTLGCTIRFDAGAEPATARFNANDPLEPRPTAPNARYAQYNETAIAGALWHVAGLLGGGDPKAGLGRMLDAFSQDPPDSMRDARDAMAADSAIESTVQEHEDIDELLRKQRINWIMRVIVTGDSGPGHRETQVKMNGAYDCQLANEFTADSGLLPEDRGGGFYLLGGEGGLPFTWHDDCFGFSDGDPDSSAPGGPEHWFVDFPTTGGTDEANNVYTLSARYDCKPFGTPDNCTAAMDAIVIIDHGVDRSTPTTSPVTHQITGALLPKNSWVPIVRFDGLGNCESLLDGFDCGI